MLCFSFFQEIQQVFVTLCSVPNKRAVPNKVCREEYFAKIYKHVVPNKCAGRKISKVIICMRESILIPIQKEKFCAF